MTNYDRLTAMDASFLAREEANPNLHMHVGGICLFDAKPVLLPDGGIDIDRLRRAIHARLHLAPRFRQRLARIPYTGDPIWIDDDQFRLAYHVRHTALPKPGDERALKRLVGRIMSQPLDRGRPLWEFWFVEGLDGDRFALISKTHHCMIDGISGADLMSVLFEPYPNQHLAKPEPWTPRPAPSATKLSFDMLRRRLNQPADVIQAVRDAVTDPDSALQSLRRNVSALGEVFGPTLHPASLTPLNVEVGPHRRFDWLNMRVADLKAVKNVLGGTLNDVVLATVAGALRKFIQQRGAETDDLRVCALVPMSVRTEGERGAMGNRIAQLVAELPVHLEDPVARLAAASETMQALKGSKQAEGIAVLTAVSEWTVPNLLVQAVRLGERTRPYNLIVTNVPGPQMPLYVHGCQMLTTYPVVTLFQNMGLVVGLFSYNGGIFWGFTADWEAVPDLHDLVALVAESFAELQHAAQQAVSRAARHARKRRGPKEVALREQSA